MYGLTLLITALGLVAAAPSNDFEIRQVAAVASVARYSAGGCTGTICNKAGSGDLHAGCNAIEGACQASLRLNYVNAGCKVAIWRDSFCKDTAQFVNVTSFDCYALGPPIKGISVTC